MATQRDITFQIGPVSGSTADLESLIKGLTIDPLARKYIQATAGRRYDFRGSYGCRFSPLRHGAVRLGAHGSYQIDGAELCAFLYFFGGEGLTLTEIPQGESELNIILGHALFEDVELVFYLEHELEDGVGGYFLRARPADHVEDDPVRVIFFG